MTPPRSPLSVAPGSALLVALLLGLTLMPPTSARAAGLPTFTYSPSSPFTGETVTFKSDFTGVTSQAWDLDGDGGCDDATGGLAQRSFQSAGVYTVRLCVTDGASKATFEQSVPVQNRPPAAAFTYAPTAPLTGDIIHLSSTSSDPDGPLASQSWDLDNDGAFDDGTGETGTVSFAQPGLYTIRLLVLDRDGAAVSTAQAIQVSSRPPELLSPFPIVRVIATVGLRGTRFRQVSIVAPAGSTVEVRCRGRRCPLDRLTRSANLQSSLRREVRTAAVVRIRRLRKRMLRPGTVLQIWVTRPGQIGKYTRFRVRHRRPPRRADRCVLPGAARPSRCPPS